MSSIANIQTPDGNTYTIKAATVDCDTSTSAWDEASDQLLVDRSGVTFKIDYNLLAKAIIEEYEGSSLGGTKQSIKSSFDNLVPFSIYERTLSGSADSLRMPLSRIGQYIVFISRLASTSSGTVGMYIIQHSSVSSVYAFKSATYYTVDIQNDGTNDVLVVTSTVTNARVTVLTI